MEKQPSLEEKKEKKSFFKTMMKKAWVDAKHYNANPANSSNAPPSSVSITHEFTVPILNTSLLNYYSMEGNKYMIIYNHHTYDDSPYFVTKPKTRYGTYEDVKALKRVCSKLNFEVLDHNDKSYLFIKDNLKTFCQRNHSNTSCVCVVILTHGGKGGELLACDRPYYLQNLLALFDKADPALTNKPKLFFVQACRGKLADDGKLVEVDSVGGSREVITIPTHSDLFILRSTVEDFVSYRGAGGSWMIQALCETVEKHHETLDIHQIVTLVNQKVAFEKISSCDDLNYDKKKQMPETWHTFTKFFKFK